MLVNDDSGHACCGTVGTCPAALPRQLSVITCETHFDMQQGASARCGSRCCQWHPSPRVCAHSDLLCSRCRHDLFLASTPFSRTRHAARADEMGGIRNGYQVFHHASGLLYDTTFGPKISLRFPYTSAFKNLARPAFPPLIPAWESAAAKPWALFVATLRWGRRKAHPSDRGLAALMRAT